MDAAANDSDDTDGEDDAEDDLLAEPIGGLGLDPATAAEEIDEEKALSAFKLTPPRWPSTKGGQDAEASLCLDESLPGGWNHPG